MSIKSASDTFELGALLSRLGVKKAPGSAAREPLCIVASITNVSQIEQVHGSTFASTMRHMVFERARALCDERTGSVAVTGDHMLFIFDVIASPSASEVGCSPIAAILLDRVLSILSERPVMNGPVVAFPVISAKVAHMDDAPFDITVIAAPTVQNAQPGKAWRDQFVSDSAIAERVFAAMYENRLDLDLEPICEALGKGAVVYEEALLCEMPAGSSTPVRIGRHLPSLERLGLMRRVDRWVVDTVVSRLRDDPDARFGCNISAQSLTVDAWWAVTLLTLAQAPAIARRLTIEITETSPLTNYGEAQGFVRAFKAVGCRVALDDVGSGYSGFKSLLSLGADVAKIDGSLVREARGGSTVAARFMQLVAFAKACVPTVVVEGIETETDARIARDSGASCLQGFLFAGHS